MVRDSRHGGIMVELVIAIGILTAAVLPLAYSFMDEQHQCHLAYIHGIAMEIVDGEMEALAAGEWHVFAEGTHDYVVHGGAVQNLPPGTFALTVQGKQLRLEWKPDSPRFGRPVVREATGK